jgi:hypothetical protein
VIVQQSWQAAAVTFYTGRQDDLPRMGFLIEFGHIAAGKTPANQAKSDFNASNARSYE